MKDQEPGDGCILSAPDTRLIPFVPGRTPLFTGVDLPNMKVALDDGRELVAPSLFSEVLLFLKERK